MKRVTGALVVVVALVACSPALATARHARLVPINGDPLRVKGTGFAPREHIRIKVFVGTRRIGRRLTASRRGSFVVTFKTVRACDGPTVIARGSRGSRASFNLSQIACLN